MLNIWPLVETPIFRLPLAGLAVTHLPRATITPFCLCVQQSVGKSAAALNHNRKSIRDSLRPRRRRNHVTRGVIGAVNFVRFALSLFSRTLSLRRLIRDIDRCFPQAPCEFFKVCIINERFYRKLSMKPPEIWLCLCIAAPHLY